jgi:hypothetical protein
LESLQIGEFPVYINVYKKKQYRSINQVVGGNLGLETPGVTPYTTPISPTTFNYSTLVNWSLLSPISAQLDRMYKSYRACNEFPTSTQDVMVKEEYYFN